LIPAGDRKPIRIQPGHEQRTIVVASRLLRIAGAITTFGSNSVSAPFAMKSLALNGYRDLRMRVIASINRINQRFATDDTLPVMMIDDHLPETVVRYR
jgi:hypothetical protein